MEDSSTSTVQSEQDMTFTKSNGSRKRRSGGQKGNKNKRKGTAFENRVSAYYTRKGYRVFRVRASLGPSDLIAIKEGEIDIHIQCKDINSNFIDRREMSEFAAFCKRYSKRSVWAYNFHDPSKKRGKMKFINLATTPVWMVTKGFYAR
jgi:hypothetical protein